MRNYAYRAASAIKVPGSDVSVLTVTSKLPGPSFSLPAARSCPNSQGSICENCYALKGFYRMHTTRRAQDIRLKWTVAAMRTPEDRWGWGQKLHEAIQRSKALFFRGHDSGDFFCTNYIQVWTGVAEKLPEVKFWFPTREYQSRTAPDNPRLDYLIQLNELPNVVVRPSALEIGQDAPMIPGLAAGSTVNNAKAYQCPAYRQNGECGDCRVCWENTQVPISYPLH